MSLQIRIMITVFYWLHYYICITCLIKCSYMDVCKAAYISYLNSPYAIQKAKKFEMCFHFVTISYYNTSKTETYTGSILIIPKAFIYLLFSKSCYMDVKQWKPYMITTSIKPKARLSSNLITEILVKCVSVIYTYISY